jgi:ribonuclease Y
MVDTSIAVVVAILAAGAGAAAGFIVRGMRASQRMKQAEEKAALIIEKAYNQQKDLILEAKDEKLRLQREAEDEARAKRTELTALERRLLQRDEQLDQRGDMLEQRDRKLIEREREIERAREELARAHQDQVDALERVSGLSAEDAKGILLEAVREEAEHDAVRIARTIERQAREEAQEKAREVIVTAMQRIAADHTAEHTVSVIHLPSDEMKGRIIGREGRNIRAFESVTGVNVIIDDTPEAVLLSCFDPVRREVGRLTLDKLVLDGRIHPHRIEEAYEQSKAEVDELCLRAARDALADVGVNDLDERLLPTLGRLKYRTSYGQNVLGHLTETAHIAGVMAAELGIEPTLVKRCAFLHDIGKALTHEVEGSHAIIGAELLRKYGESEAVAHAVEAHHNEVQPRTIEAVLTQASDTCSAARPGARRESLESYVKRLARIEEIASAKEGVEKVFAMQAGREVRVMVQPSEVDDLAAQVIAREIAKQIEDELTYPGQIRVTVVRESRSTEIAH